MSHPFAEVDIMSPERSDSSSSSSSEEEDEEEVLAVIPVVASGSQPDRSMKVPKSSVQIKDKLDIDEDAPVLEMEDFNMARSLLAVLECPVCFDYMIPPITLCCSGHNTCQKCRPQLDACPICRCGFIETRNVALEGIARELLYPCRNRRAGCDEKYPMELINDHQDVCPRRTYSCPVSHCEWKGRRHEILEHAGADHPGQTWKQEKFSFFYTELKNSYHTDIIDALGEIFVLYRKYDEEQQCLFAVVQYVGPSENAAHYKYEFEFLSLGEPKSVIFRNVTQADTLLVEDIFLSGNCVNLSHNVMMNLFKDTEMWCSLAVSSSSS